MPGSHPPYPPEFRQQMVELVRAGRTPQELAAELNPPLRASAIGSNRRREMKASVRMA